jgi:hypothetical protein
MEFVNVKFIVTEYIYIKSEDFRRAFWIIKMLNLHYYLGHLLRNGKALCLQRPPNKTHWHDVHGDNYA